jgi:hypothetical protein
VADGCVLSLPLGVDLKEEPVHLPVGEEGTAEAETQSGSDTGLHCGIHYSGSCGR